MHRHHRRAFTLIELMIAIGLGSLIVYSATAGFRMAAQSVTLVNRLALENSLMRAGCQTAHDRLDFWTDYDDPDCTSSQTMRGSDANGGLPFTPLSVTFPLTKNTNPELVTGWNSSDPWPAADPRTWWHGNMAEKFQTNMVLGRYGIFANYNPKPVITGGIGTYGTVTVPHSWQYNQIWGMHNALGFYAYADYMPANTLYACYSTYANGSTNDDGMPFDLFQPGKPFDNGEGYQEYCKGLWRLTMASSYGVISPTSPWSVNPASHQQRYTTGYWNDVNDYKNRFLPEIQNARSLLRGPANWPAATVTSMRFIKTCRFVNLCRVQWTSPLTGESVQVAFTSLGTTLRGARLQRRHPSQGGGWATWDDSSGAINSLTLDDTPP